MQDAEPSAPHFTEDCQWYVCHTQSRCEKKLAQVLAATQHEHYLPLYQVEHQYEGRSRNYTKPLLPGYLFAKLPPGEHPVLRNQGHLIRLIPDANQERLLGQIEDIRRLVDSGLPTSLVPRFDKGTRVRVRSGPLQGIIALIEDTESHRGILIGVDVLREGLLVPVPQWNLEILD